MNTWCFLIQKEKIFACFVKVSLEKDDAGKESEEVRNWCFYFLWYEFNFGLKILIWISTSTVILKSAESCLYLESDVDKKNRQAIHRIGVILWDCSYRTCLKYEETWTRHWIFKCFVCTSVLGGSFHVAPVLYWLYSTLVHSRLWAGGGCAAPLKVMELCCLSKADLKGFVQKKKYLPVVHNCSNVIDQEIIAVKCLGHWGCSTVTHMAVSEATAGWNR